MGTPGPPDGAPERAVVALVTDLMDRSRLGVALPGVEFAGDPGRVRGRRRGDRGPRRPRRSRPRRGPGGRPRGPDRGLRAPRRRGRAGPGPLRGRRPRPAPITVLPRSGRAPWLRWTEVVHRGMLPARNAGEQEGVEHHVSCLLPRLIRATDGPGTITFLGSARSAGAAGAGARGETVEWARLFEDAQGIRRRPAGPRRRARVARRAARPDLPARSSPRSRRPGSPARRSSCLPLPMRLGSIEEFVAPDARRRIQNADADVVVVDPELEPFLAVEPGDPPIVRLDELRGRPASWERPDDDPDALGDHPVHERIDRRPEGRDAPAALPGEQHRRHRRGRRARRRGPRRLVAAAVPRHGSHRSPDDADAHRASTSPSRRPRTSSRRRATGCAGCRSTAGRSPADRTSRTRSPRRAMRRLDGLDLSAWRMALNGAEPIDPACRRGVQRGRRPPRARLEGAVLRLRHGRGDAGDLVPRPRHRHDASTSSTTSRSRPSASPRPRRPRAPTPAGSSLLGRTLRGLELRVCDPETGSAPRRPRGRRARAAGQLGDARLLPPRRR